VSLTRGLMDGVPSGWRVRLQNEQQHMIPVRSNGRWFPSPSCGWCGCPLMCAERCWKRLLADAGRKLDAAEMERGRGSPRSTVCTEHQRGSPACWKCTIYRECSRQVGTILDNDLTQLRRVLLTAHQVTVDAGYATTPFAVRQTVQHAIEAGPQQATWDIAQEMWEDGRLDTPTSATSCDVPEAGNTEWTRR
jgi:hypothetical protein